MSLSNEIRKIRQKGFLSQTAFAEKVQVAYISVNRWETGKSIPNLAALKKIKEYCNELDIPFENLESEWFKIKEHKLCEVEKNENQ